MNVQTVTSDLGLTFWHVEKNDVPVVAIHFAWRGGVETDAPAKLGLARLAMEMLTEGAGELDASAFQGQLADNGITLNLDAARDQLPGSIYALKADLPKAIQLTRLAITAPRLDDDAFTRAKAQQIAIVKQQIGEPDWQARYRLMQAVFPGHPYSQRSAGTANTILSITKDDVKNFYSARMARDNLVIVVVGDLSQVEAKKAVDQIFGSLPATSQAKPVPKASWPAASTTLVERKGAQTVWQWALPGMDDDDPDWFAASLINYVWGGGGFSSRLMQEVREEQGLTYGIATGLSSMEYGNMWLGQAALADDKLAHASSYVKNMMVTLRDGGITEAELSSAKTYLINSLMLDLTSSRAMAGVLLDWQLAGRPVNFLDQRRAGLEALTLADVNRVVKRLVDPDKMMTVYVGQPKGVDAARAPWMNE